MLPKSGLATPGAFGPLGVNLSLDVNPVHTNMESCSGVAGIFSLSAFGALGPLAAKGRESLQ
jgi:hypothetical protein